METGAPWELREEEEGGGGVDWMFRVISTSGRFSEVLRKSQTEMWQERSEITEMR